VASRGGSADLGTSHEFLEHLDRSADVERRLMQARLLDAEFAESPFAGREFRLELLCPRVELSDEA
jgi:hypothetical protein